MKRLKTKRGGFTLIEVVISLAVFTMVILVFAVSMPMAEKSADMNGQYAQAISLCQHKIDQLRSVGYGRITYDELSDAGIIDTSPSSGLYFSFTGVDNISTYLQNPDARIYITNVSTGIVEVTVTITWKKSSYETKTSTLTVKALITNVG
jgi:prepilin-type N-terminal cleavage/methylation domain-containing protein